MLKLLLTFILLAFSLSAYAYSKVNTNQMVEVPGDNPLNLGSSSESVKVPFYIDAGSDFGSGAKYLQIKIYGVTYYSDKSCTANPRTVDQNTNSWATFPRLQLSSEGPVGYINYYVSSLNIIDQSLAGDYKPTAGGCAKIDIAYRECDDSDPSLCSSENINENSSELETVSGSKSLTCSDFTLDANGDITDCTMNAGSSAPIDVDKQGKFDFFPESTYGPNEIRQYSFSAGQEGKILLKNVGTNTLTFSVHASAPYTNDFTHNCTGSLAPQQSCDVTYHGQGTPGHGSIYLVTGSQEYSFPFSISETGTPECFGTVWPDNTINPAPTPLLDGSPVVTFGDYASTAQHGCAVVLHDNKQVAACWGKNTYGQIGDNTRYGDHSNKMTFVHTSSTDSTPLGAASGASPIKQITSAFGTSCALTEDGHVKCWGWNQYGQLGNNSSSFMLYTPVDVCDSKTCDKPLSNVTQIASGLRHTCALTKFGSVKCWGWNQYGQLGDGDTSKTSENHPVDVSGLNKDVVSISAGAFYTCATMQDGGVKCWGYNDNGQLGNNSEVQSDTPTDVCATSSTPGVCDTTLKGVSFIEGGTHTTCARMTDGTVKCWGSNTRGMLATGSTTPSESLLPVSTTGLSDIASLQLGWGHGCALNSSGNLYCWGSNGEGSYGNGTQTPSSNPTPTLISNGVWGNLVVGSSFTCATERPTQNRLAK